MSDIVHAIGTMFLCLVRHDVSTSSTDPSTKAVLESTIAENDADRLVSNLRVSKLSLSENTLVILMC